MTIEQQILTGTNPVQEALRKLQDEGWLPKAQIRILAALSRARGPLDKNMIAERAEVPESHVVGFTEKQYASKPTAALVEMGLVTVKETDDGKLYRITDAGRNALKLVKAQLDS